MPPPPPIHLLGYDSRPVPPVLRQLVLDKWSQGVKDLKKILLAFCGVWMSNNSKHQTQQMQENVHNRRTNYEQEV